MAVLLTKKARVVVQGITGHQGQFHARAMRDFGTKVVAGVTPGKGGTKVDGVPVFDGVREAVLRRKANASILFVPAPHAKDAAIEAIEAGLKLLVIITERIPFHDALDLMPFARSKGVTVRGTIDCIIAQTCISAGLELLSTDQDFAAIARHTPLRLCAV